MDACDAIYGFVLDIVDACMFMDARVYKFASKVLWMVFWMVYYVQCSVVRFYGWAYVMKILFIVSVRVGGILVSIQEQSQRVNTRIVGMYMYTCRPLYVYICNCLFMMGIPFTGGL